MDRVIMHLLTYNNVAGIVDLIWLTWNDKISYINCNNNVLYITSSILNLQL